MELEKRKIGGGAQSKADRGNAAEWLFEEETGVDPRMIWRDPSDLE